jgi:hypothetical protein
VFPRSLASLHDQRIRVLILEPIGRAAGTVGRILTLRDDAFEPQLAGMVEDGRAVAFDMLIEPDAGASLGYDRRERLAIGVAIGGVGHD